MPKLLLRLERGENMAKSKSIKPIYLVIIVILIILLFVGFYYKNAYASELNEVYTIEEIYDLYNISEDIRVSPKEYGHERVLIVVNTLDNKLTIVCFDNPFDLGNIISSSGQVKYIFEGTTRCICYDYVRNMVDYNDTFENPYIWIADEPIYETTYDKNHSGSRIIYSSHDIYKPDGTLFFSARKMTRIARIVGNLQMGMVMKEVVSLIPIAVGFLVSFLGFRKALALLRRLLHQA